MTLQHHRPDGRGGVEPRRVSDQNWQNSLRSPRWGASLRSDRLPELKNPEMNPTSTLRSIAFWVALAALTFLILVIGYGVGFWQLPAPNP